MGAVNSPDSKKQQAAWRKIVAPYERAHWGRALWQCTNTFIPFFVLWGVMTWTIHFSFALTFGLAVLAAGFCIRIFIISHDCGHGSFFPSRRANDLLGAFTGLLTFTPYRSWRHEHAAHHATSGNLDERGIGDVTTLTVREYRALTRGAKIRYRIYRNPLFMFSIGALLLFLIRYRLPIGLKGKRERRSVWKTNAAIIAMAAGMSALIGVKEYLLIQLAITSVSASAGVWLFYVQHQFEGVYWERGEEWSYLNAALEGSSSYRLPRVLQWFTGNIGFHHVHHLSPRIPNYYLEKCHQENSLFQNVKEITFFQSLRCLTYRLFDEETGRLTSFRVLRKAA